MSRTSHLVVLMSIIASAALVGTGAVVIATAHTAAADGAVAAHQEAIVQKDAVLRQDAALRRTPDQVVRGALDTAHSTDAVTFAYAGDSITARPDSWLHQLEGDPDLHAVGGYAHSGYRSDQVLHEIGPVPDADVLVVELGTNDVNQAVPVGRITANVDAVVRKVDAHHVLVVAGPPSDRTTSLWGADRRAGQLVLSRELRAEAQEHGWSYVDPFTAIRTSDGAYEPGTTPDGIHPTAAANVRVAQDMADAIEAAAR